MYCLFRSVNEEGGTSMVTIKDPLSKHMRCFCCDSDINVKSLVFSYTGGFKTQDLRSFNLCESCREECARMIEKELSCVNGRKRHETNKFM